MIFKFEKPNESTHKLKPNSSYLILNGKILTAEEISVRVSSIQSNPFDSEFEQELYLFLEEWFSVKDFVIAQTSGSTGEPKIIELPKFLMQKSAGRTIQYFELNKSSRLLLSLPCRYIAGKMMVVRAIVGQMNLITVDPATDFSFLQKETFDFGALVPNQVFKLLGQPGGEEKIQRIKSLLIGGSGISADLEARISRLPNRIVSTYGMTETASHIAIRELSGARKADYYQCLPQISVELNDKGCLKIRVPELDEPLQTNDLAELLPGNGFRILGRADSVIISGGIKYTPEVIEKKLEGLMLQRRFVISAIPDEKLGMKLVLVIEGAPFQLELLRKQLTNVLPVYEQPRQFFFLDQFPETTSGKIQRNRIMEIISDRQS